MNTSKASHNASSKNIESIPQEITQIVNSSDNRQHFTMIPNFVFKVLTPRQRALFIHYWYTAGEKGECFKSHRTLCEETGMGKATLKEARDELEAMGLITVTPGTTGVPGKSGNPTRVKINYVWNLNRLVMSNTEETERLKQLYVQAWEHGDQNVVLVHGIPEWYIEKLRENGYGGVPPQVHGVPPQVQNKMYLTKTHKKTNREIGEETSLTPVGGAPTALSVRSANGIDIPPPREHRVTTPKETSTRRVEKSTQGKLADYICERLGAKQLTKRDLEKINTMVYRHGDNDPENKKEVGVPADMYDEHKEFRIWVKGRIDYLIESKKTPSRNYVVNTIVSGMTADNKYGWSAHREKTMDWFSKEQRAQYEPDELQLTEQEIYEGTMRARLDLIGGANAVLNDEAREFLAKYPEYIEEYKEKFAKRTVFVESLETL